MKFIRVLTAAALFAALFVLAFPVHADCGDGDPNCILEPPISVEIRTDSTSGDASVTVSESGALAPLDFAVPMPLPRRVEAPSVPAQSEPESTDSIPDFANLSIPMRYQTACDVSCGFFSDVASSPELPATKTKSPATMESTAPPTGTTEAPTPTPTLAPPEGAGPIQPRMTLEFHTGVADLPPGEYLLVASGDSQALQHDVLRRDTRQRIPLFTILNGDTTAIGNDWMDPGSLQVMGNYHDDQLSDGLFAVDLQAQALRGFDYGCQESRVNMGGYLAYRCHGNRSIWHFVSREDWTVSFSRSFLPVGPNEWTDLQWGRSHVLYISHGDFDLGTDQICLIEPDYSRVSQCQEISSFRSIHFSPDGEWMEFQVRDEGEYRYGFMSTRCLRDTDQDCEPSFIEDPPVDWPGDINPNVIWYPDGEKLLYLKAQCMGENNATFWTYDRTLQQSEVIANFPICYTFALANGQPIWSPDESEVLIIGNRAYYLFSPETGQLRQLLSGYPDHHIVGTFTLPLE